MLKFLYHELPSTPSFPEGILAANVDAINYFRAVKKGDWYVAEAVLKNRKAITLRVGFENAAETWLYITKLIREINTEEQCVIKEDYMENTVIKHLDGLRESGCQFVLTLKTDNDRYILLDTDKVTTEHYMEHLKYFLKILGCRTLRNPQERSLVADELHNSINEFLPK